MAIQFTLALTIFIGNLITTCNAFQVTQDPSNIFKEAIEKSTKKNIGIIDHQHPLVPLDDKTYSPKLLQYKAGPIFLQEKKKQQQQNPSQSIHSFTTTTLSDQLRFQNEFKNKTNNPKPVTALPLFKSGFKYIPPHRNGVARKRFGYDELPTEYWFHNKIHTFGNTGLGGWIHAAVAPLATKLIDNSAYNGEDVRTRVSIVHYCMKFYHLIASFKCFD